MRHTLEEYAGQHHLLGPEGPTAPSGGGDPPQLHPLRASRGGQDHLVRLLARTTGRPLLEINAVSAKVAQLRELVDQARDLKARQGPVPLAFVDEIYHFNTQQQNALLPAVETGGSPAGGHHHQPPGSK